jgi:hypothetical protein
VVTTANGMGRLTGAKDVSIDGVDRDRTPR